MGFRDLFRLRKKEVLVTLEEIEATPRSLRKKSQEVALSPADLRRIAGASQQAIEEVLGLKQELEYVPNGSTFVTGSRCYGVPSPESDLDLVLYMAPRDFKILAETLWPEGYLPTGVTSSEEPSRLGTEEHPEGLDGGSFKFGMLNLIIVTDLEKWKIWRKGTKQLVRRKIEGEVITKEEAIKTFTRLVKKSSK